VEEILIPFEKGFQIVKENDPKDIVLKALVRSKEEFDRLNKEIELKDKSISLLTETLASRDKEIETLKAEINRQNNIIADYMNTNASLRELAAEEKKVIKAMAKWMHEHEQTPNIIPEGCSNITECCDIYCTDCIINHFESEVKE
jgi:septal ring factor EnvC (AmiA/AmiB activator)